MKSIWFILPVLLASLLYSQSKMDINNLIDRGGLLYAPNEDKPFSGIVFDLYDNGKKKLNGKYKNGLKNGKWIWRYENGNKKEEGRINMMGMKEKQIVYREDGSTITDSDEIFQNDMNITLNNMKDDYNKNSKDLGLDTTFDDFLDIIRGK